MKIQPSTIILSVVFFLGLGYVASKGAIETLPLIYLPWIACLIALGLSIIANYKLTRINESISTSAKGMGLSLVSKEPLDLTREFALECERFRQAVVGLHQTEQGKVKDLGVSLRNIARLVYDELSADAVELCLFDADLGQWSQGMVLGAPRSVNSLAMIAAAAESGERQMFSYDRFQVLVVPVMFSGRVFGAIRVEIPRSANPSANDLNLLNLFAMQGAIALIDARFSDELLRLKRASDETVKAKTGFLANLSHELRGPLGTILNGVELISDGLCGPVSEEQLSTLNMVKSSGEHLLDLVNDVLDYAKVEAGKIVPRPVQIRVADLLDDLATVIRSQAADKGHSLLTLPVEKGLGLICDKRHARQMLINLLTNAVKYTPENGKITLGAERASANRVKIFVEDNGIGIPENQQDKVFAAFERVDDRYAQSQIGAGLGMSLTKKLAEVNGGTVEFTSRPSEGSCFWILLPAVEIEEDAQIEEEVFGELEAQGRGETILLIDHDLSSRQMLGTYLTSQGFEILQAKSGQEVFRILKEARVSLAVVESDMPDLPGEDMVAAIRSNPSAIAVPIILLSSKAFVFDIERFLKLGVDRCLSKPVSLNEVALTARRLIDESERLYRNDKSNCVIRE